jgi:hypothetical protein
LQGSRGDVVRWLGFWLWVRLWFFLVVGLEADLDAGEQEPPVCGDEGVGGVHGDVAAPAEQRAVLHAEEVGVALLPVTRGDVLVRIPGKTGAKIRGRRGRATI